MKSCFKVDKSDIKLIEFLSNKLPGISKGIFQKQLKLREIKINGKKVNSNEILKLNDDVEIFLPLDFCRPIEIEVVFEDDNILVVDKPINMDTVEGLLPLLKKDRNELFAVHRLDRNTSGLVIFAKTKDAEKELTAAFKNRKVDKFYEAIVLGKMPKKSDCLTAYLKKDEEKKVSLIAFKEIAGYALIETDYTVIKEENELSFLKVKLVTGKMHQIRAHLAAIGHPILGDEKYGDSIVNKKFGKKYQELKAVEIRFTGLAGKLEYLNGKILQLNGVIKE